MAKQPKIKVPGLGGVPTKEEEQALLVQEQAPSLSPANQAEQLISQAISQNVPVETMERLLAMRRELKAEFAKEAFDRAMASFQGECPTIKKTKEGGKTRSGQVAYYYAPLDSIVDQTRELIQKYGFSYAIQTVTEADKVKVTCKVKHESGHAEASDVEVPLGAKTDIMSASQVVASALTFAKRYAFCNAFGILTGDDDNDSQKMAKLEKDPPGYAVLLSAVKRATKEQLVDYQKKMEQSDKYTPEQKAQYAKVVESRLLELENPPHDA